MGFFQSSGILNRRGFFGAKAFSPLDISGLDLWLDAADGNTLYDATSGGNLVTSDGSAVKRWEDKSGNSNHATEATAAPLLEVAEKNGFNALNFATSKYLTCSFTSKTFTAQTVFAVFRFSTSTPNYGRIFTQSILNDNDYSIAGHYIPILKDGASNQIISWANSSSRSTVSASGNTWYVARSRHSGSSLTVKLNNSQGSAYSHTLNRNFAFYRIGAAYVAPSGGTDAAFWNSLMSEIIVYTKSLSDSESDSVTNYLNNKWAVY
jgi:hypothetical protein